MRTSRQGSLRAVASGCATGVTIALALLFAAAAVATPLTPHEYSLSVVEGANTQPEDPILSVSGWVHPRAQVAVSITRNGLVIEKQSHEEGVWISQVPQVGDIVTLESPAGTVRGAVVYDGLPSLDPTVCAGSANFSGQRTAGYTIEGGYYTVVPHPSYFARRGGGMAQVQTLAGTAFQGSFLAPLQLGETVFAVESLTSPIAGGGFTYSSEYDRPVGACPAPPLPPPPPPPVALSGSFAGLTRVSIRGLLRSGWSTRVNINQPGTVVEDLYLSGGRVPAFAAASKHSSRRSKRHHGKPPALLIARGTATAGGAGTVTVVMRVTAAGRRACGTCAAPKSCWSRPSTPAPAPD